MKTYKQFINEINSSTAKTFFGLSNSFTEDELKLAYRKASAKYHPDKGGDVELMKQANTAYELLKKEAGSEQRAVDSRQEWEDRSAKYRGYAQFVTADLVPKFEPAKFVTHFESIFKEPFNSVVKVRDNTNINSPTYAGLTAEFSNKDKTITFDLDISVYLVNIAKMNSSMSLNGGNTDISYSMTVTAVGYSNNKKTKMTQRDWSFKDDHSILKTPEKIYPKSKVIKMLPTGEATEPKKMSKASFILGLEKEVGASRFNVDIYCIPLSDGNVITVARQVFMKQGTWQVLNIGTRLKYRVEPIHNIFHVFTEDTQTLNYFKQFTKMDAHQVKTFIQSI
jgi:curved DNA-binding protein CbpA